MEAERRPTATELTDSAAATAELANATGATEAAADAAELDNATEVTDGAAGAAELANVTEAVEAAADAAELDNATEVTDGAADAAELDNATGATEGGANAAQLDNATGTTVGTADAADLDNAAELTLTAFCWWRSDLPQEVCETYWRDVHGIMFARAPGLWKGRQLWLAANRPDLWPTIPGIAFDAPDVAQPQGMSYALFLSQADLAEFSGHPLAAEIIPNDARNFIGRIGAQLSAPGTGRTLVDRLDDPLVQGSPDVPTFMLCFAAKPDVTAEAFHHHLTKQLAPRWSEHPGVARLRVQPLPHYDRSAMATPGIPHAWPGGDSYLGWIELAVRDEAVLGELLTGTTAETAAEQLAAVHTYPVRESYTSVHAGKPTEVGLRGYPAVRAISAVGAARQRTEAVQRLLFGDIVRGLTRREDRP